LDAGRTDFADVAAGKRLALIHPGAILHDDFLQSIKISVYTLAQAIKVRGRASTTSRLAAGALPLTRRFASPAISVPRRIRGTTTPAGRSFAMTRVD
jgi:hypothetical protein